MSDRITPEALWAIPRVDPAAGGGSHIIVPVTKHTDADKTTNLWVIEEGEGTPYRITTETATKPAFDAASGRIAFLRPVEGRNQVHVISLEGGEATRVSDLPLGALGAVWHPKGLVVLANVYRDRPGLEDTRDERDRRETARVKAHVTENAVYRYWDTWLTDGVVPHLFLIEIETGRVTDLTPDSRRWMRWPNTADPIADVAVSPDGREISYCADVSEPPHRMLRWALFTIDVETGEEVCLTTDATGHAHRPRYSPDGRFLLYGLQQIPDFYADRVRLALYDRAARTHEALTEDWDRSAADWHWTPDAIVFVAEDRGRQPVWSLDPGGDRQPRVLCEGGTFASPFSLDSGAVVAHHSSLLSPPEIVRIDEAGWKPITTFTKGSTDGLELGTFDEITVTGAREDPIQVFLLRPPNPFPEARPLVHLIHGGPHGVFGDVWHWRWNATVIAAAGYLVAMVNFHGSTSFGQEFTESIQGEWGDMPSTDIEAATDELIARGWVDPQRMALTGGSYGGYLVAWLTANTDRYACAVAHAAVTDLPAMYATDITMGRQKAYGAEVYEDMDRVNRWSPAARAAGYSTPTLVIHGDNDYRVPVTQGLELYGVLQAKGVDARLVHYPDENHWILTRHNSIHWYHEVLSWLERYL